jgi:predicted transcriptional regulator
MSLCRLTQSSSELSWRCNEVRNRTDDIAAELFASTQSRNISPAVYVSELVCQALANERLGDSGKLENRPDWQRAIQEGREDIRAGRVFAHEKVMEWHERHSE